MGDHRCQLCLACPRCPVLVAVRPQHRKCLPRTIWVSTRPGEVRSILSQGAPPPPGGDGSMGASLPTGQSAALPAAAAASPSVGALAPPAGAAPPSAGGGGMRGGGMYPPMMGAGQGGQTAERDKAMHPDKRVVHQEMANTEAVFGEIERERKRPPRKRPTQEQEEPHGDRPGTTA